MSKTITVVENRAYVDRELLKENGETTNPIFVTGVPPPTNTKDSMIESHGHRGDFVEGEGDLSVIIEAGDELGDIRVGIQFEGPIGKHTHCLTKQNEVLQDGMDWLREIFSKFGGEWQVHMVSSPCPKGDTSILQLHDAQRRLEGIHQVRHDPTRTVEVSHQNDVKLDA